MVIRVSGHPRKLLPTSVLKVRPLLCMKSGIVSLAALVCTKLVSDDEWVKIRKGSCRAYLRIQSGIFNNRCPIDIWSCRLYRASLAVSTQRCPCLGTGCYAVHLKLVEKKLTLTRYTPQERPLLITERAHYRLVH